MVFILFIFWISSFFSHLYYSIIKNKILKFTETIIDTEVDSKLSRNIIHGIIKFILEIIKIVQLFYLYGCPLVYYYL